MRGWVERRSDRSSRSARKGVESREDCRELRTADRSTAVGGHPSLAAGQLESSSKLSRGSLATGATGDQHLLQVRCPACNKLAGEVSEQAHVRIKCSRCREVFEGKVVLTQRA